MTDYFKINGIEVGFANHPTENSVYTKGALDTEVLVRKGNLRINVLTPALELSDALHNGLLSDPYFNNQRHIEYLRLATYRDLALETGAYDTQITCPYDKITGFEVYGFPINVNFHGIIDVQKGHITINGVLKSVEDAEHPGIPIAIRKSFDAKPLIPKRKTHSLQSASTEDPLKVYHLALEKGPLHEFPIEICRYKNLESLVIYGYTQPQFSQLPDAFYGLTKLHTINIYQSNLEQLSPQLGQLTQLEELTIQSSNLQQLPETIGALKALTTVDFENNLLTSLPESLIHLPQLKTLNLTGNSFKSLPESLAQLRPILSIDRKHLKLFTDASYPSKNTQAIDDSLFDFTHYPTEKQQLATAIDAIPELAIAKSILMDYSRVATYIILHKDQKDIAVGASKIGGAPDLPAHLDYPKDKNGKHYLFHAQLNCAALATYQHYLPRKGMLYFFVNDVEYANTPKVLYSETDTSLVPYEFPEDFEFIDGDAMPLSAVAVSFKNGISLPNFYNSYNYGEDRFPKYKALWETEENALAEFLEDSYEFMEQLEKALDKPEGFNNGHIVLNTHSINSPIFTQHESPEEQAAAKYGGEATEWMPLLCLESIDELSFWDAGTLTYCIHKKDLAIADFKTIYSGIESS